MKRKIIRIDEKKCTGCGLCIPNCPEGAIQIIDGKARLVSDLMCDGLGACLGHCPEGAISIEEREAKPYDEAKVMANIVKAGPNTVKAHLEHLRDHQQMEYLGAAMRFLEENGIPNPLAPQGRGPTPSPSREGNNAPTPDPFHLRGYATAGQAREGDKSCAGGAGSAGQGHSGCPGSRAMQFKRQTPAAETTDTGPRPSQLTHWPIQLHLLGPQAPHYQGSDLLLAADCTAFALGDFHKDYLKGKTLAIACPKLDEGQEVYVEKIRMLMDEARINTLTVMIMQVPCCGGLLRLAQKAAAEAKRKVPIKCVVVGLGGDILKEEWV